MHWPNIKFTPSLSLAFVIWILIPPQLQPSPYWQALIIITLDYYYYYYSSSSSSSSNVNIIEPCFNRKEYFNMTYILPFTVNKIVCPERD
jgi:hypothetical protein